MERLQKVIAQAGIASRRKAEELIQQGKVKVNGKVMTELGTKVSVQDKVEVNNIPLEKETPAYFLLYKPTGVISSVTDDKGRKVVTDFFPEIPQRLFPIGRLDYDTSGLILMTNDGEFANILMHPKYKVEKTYVAKVKGPLTGEKIRMLERGVMLEEGKTAPARVKILSWDKRKEIAIVQLTIHEGRNRQVRRMFEAVGCKVMKLKRESYGCLELGNLRPGDARELSPHEVKQLRALASTKPR
ncbi:23S rRNA pseudouridine(2605) synthase RluB [Bacillus sp. 123MFChir2]|uniref:23S rRNA pseudouridine(2605) synthase RluB n=1 Tax=Bacillus sp. 123MFChir2 TaxID=1169144 RepID=UPI000380DEB8|nr:pseudouridine synthase [Bacillus sp. 123MFChir2]